jgi:hypothetical protein
MALLHTRLISFLIFVACLLQPAFAQGNDDGNVVTTLIGDLRFRQITQLGREIADILLGNSLDENANPADVQGQSAKIVAPPVIPNGQDPVQFCKQSGDTCCIWHSISKDLTEEFTEFDGTCNDAARAAIRLGFHDAGPWSQSKANEGFDFGGADGSLALFQDEIDRDENNGLQDIIKVAQAYQSKYKVGMADLIQYMAKHATVTCPFGPRIRTFIGRKVGTIRSGGIQSTRLTMLE